MMEANHLEMESLGQRIKRFRKERGLSQIDLAKSCGVTDPWISQVEQDKVTPSANLLNNIATTLKVSMRELLHDEDKNMELSSRIKLVEVLLETKQTLEAESIIQQLHSQADLQENETIKLQLYLSECKYQQERYDDALEILNPLIYKLEAENYHDVHTLAWIRNTIGKAHFKKAEYTNAYYNYQKAYDLTSRFIEFDSLAARISYNVGMTLRRRGANTSSLPYLERAQSFFQKMNSQWELANSLLEQGLAYKNIQEYSKACEYFDQAKALFQLLNLRKWENEVQITLASSITAQNDPLKALQQLQRPLEIMLEENDFTGVVFIYTKMAEIHLNEQDFSNSINLLHSAYKLIQDYSLFHTLESGECHLVFSKHFYLNKQFTQAIDFALKANEIFGRIALIRDQVTALKIAVDSYASIGDFEEAFRLERRRNEHLYQLSEERS